MSAVTWASEAAPRDVAEHPVQRAEPVRYRGRDGIVLSASEVRRSPLADGPYQLLEVATPGAHVMLSTENSDLILAAVPTPRPFVAAEVVIP